MIKALVLGAIQGIAEWLPISSEGATVLAQLYIFGETSVSDALSLSLFLHIGTLLSVIMYFWSDIKELSISLFTYNKQNKETKAFLNFLIVTTGISGVLGFGLLKAVEASEEFFAFSGQAFTLVIAIALLVTALLLYSQKMSSFSKSKKDVTLKDSILLGVTQGLAIIPGVSRSGSTVSVLLLRKFSEDSALKISFLMSVPLVAAGSLYLAFDTEAFLNWSSVVALLSAFVFGLLTIGGLLRFAKKVNFAHFVLVFSFLTFASLLI